MCLFTLMNDEDDDIEDYDIELESYAEEDIEDGEWTLDKFASNSCLCQFTLGNSNHF